MWESLLKHNTATAEGSRQSGILFQKPDSHQTKINWSSVATVTTSAIVFFFLSFNHRTDRLILPDLFLNKILCTLTVYTENRRVNRSKRSKLFEEKEMRWRRSLYRRVISALLQYLIWGYSFDATVLEDEEKWFRLAAGSPALRVGGGNFPRVGPVDGAPAGNGNELTDFFVGYEPFLPLPAWNRWHQLTA